MVIKIDNNQIVFDMGYRRIICLRFRLRHTPTLNMHCMKPTPQFSKITNKEISRGQTIFKHSCQGGMIAKPTCALEQLVWQTPSW